MKYRKKPIVIEAIRWTGHNLDVVMREMGFVPRHPVTEDGGLIVPTLEGQLQVRPGSWLIRGIAGEFYPCDPDIFAATYEPVDDTTAKGGGE